MNAPPIQYVTTPDGYSIAYTVAGEGRPFVLMPRPFNNIQLFWQRARGTWEILELLAARFRLVAYDARWQGLSSRGVRDHEDWAAFELTDLETVLDHLGLEDVTLMAENGWAHAAVPYAVEHPERLHSLVLESPFLYGADAVSASTLKLSEERWDFFLRMMVGPAEPALVEIVAANFGASTTQSDWLARNRSFSRSDISDLLPRISTPTLVLHPRRQEFISLQQAAAVAAQIPYARFVRTDDLFFREPGPALQAIEAFLQDVAHARREATPNAADALQTVHVSPRPRDFLNSLTDREMEVLRLIAQGRSNQQIADELVVSVRTVERHITNLYGKIGAHGKAEATSYALRAGLA